VALLRRLGERAACGAPDLQACFGRLLWHCHRAMLHAMSAWCAARALAPTMCPAPRACGAASAATHMHSCAGIHFLPQAQGHVSGISARAAQERAALASLCAIGRCGACNAAGAAGWCMACWRARPASYSCGKRSRARTRWPACSRPPRTSPQRSGTAASTCEPALLRRLLPPRTLGHTLQAVPGSSYACKAVRLWLQGHLACRPRHVWACICVREDPRLARCR